MSRIGSSKTRARDNWKCPDCGMTERKEPHNRLRDHMQERHGKRWDESKNAYVVQP